MHYHIVYDADGVIRSQIGDIGDGQAEAHAAAMLELWPTGGVLIADAPADPETQMVVDGALVEMPASTLLSRDAFILRFTEAERLAITSTIELMPLALAVLSAPNGVDVTDATAQQARAALAAAGWSAERLDAIFAAPA